MVGFFICTSTTQHVCPKCKEGVLDPDISPEELVCPECGYSTDDTTDID